MAIKMDNYHLRPASTADVPAIREIFAYYIINTTATWRYEVPDLDWMFTWFEQHQNDNKPVWVACINDQIIGYASLSAFRLAKAIGHVQKTRSILFQSIVAMVLVAN